MENNYTVYKHINPNSGECFYVGIGSPKRAFDFFNRSVLWKRYTQKHGRPIVEIVKEKVGLSEAAAIERRLIKLYGRMNIGNGNLLNLTDGGDGTNGFNHDKQTRIKMSLSKMGRKVPIEVVEKISNTNKGQKRTEETKKLIGQKSIGRRSKLVLNLQTGIFYSSIDEATSVVSHIKRDYLRKLINGNRRNWSDFILV
jgi:hypothetical protein